MWFIGVEVEQETSAPPPKKNPASAPGSSAKPLEKCRFHCQNNRSGNGLAGQF